MQAELLADGDRGEEDTGEILYFIIIHSIIQKRSGGHNEFEIL